MFQQTGYQLVSDFPAFPRFLREHVVDEVVIALPMESSYGQAARIATLCEEQGIMVRLLSDIFNLRLAHSRAEEFEGEALTTLYTGLTTCRAALTQAHLGCLGVPGGDAAAVATVFAGRH